MRSGLKDKQRAVTLPPEVDDLATTLEVPAASEKSRYETLGMLGEGGMGNVFLVMDHLIGRDVAMKVMRPGRSARSELRGRFLREVLVQGQLEHPSIVPVYDLMANADGSPGFTMKRVRGVTLEEVIDALRAGEPDVVRAYTRHKLLTAFDSVCLAMELAHARGVLHRDLKPSNVMLGDFGEVYLLDWGVAKLAGDAEEAVGTTNASAAGVETQAGAVMGTPGYIAPERLSPGSAVDLRADVYSLGAILFEILALEPLHVAGVTASTLNASSKKGPDARPSARSPSRNVPPELDAICMKATALSPSDRFATCRELHEALARFLEGDRDLERRRQMAEDLTVRTRALLSKGTHRKDPLARASAIRDLGRALALDPGSTAAADALLGLLTAPPAELPRDAEDEFFAEERGISRVRARTGAIAFLLWMGVLPFAFWSGVQSLPLLAMTALTFLATGAALFGVARKPPRDGSSPLHVTLLASLAVASTYPIFGPLVGLPGMAAACALGFSIGQRRHLRWAPLALGLLAMLVPLGLELAGVLPRSYRFEDGMMCVVPHAVVLREGPTYGFFLLVSVVLIAMGAYFGSTLGGALTAAHRRLHLSSWQLRQLVPPEARGSGPTLTEGPVSE